MPELWTPGHETLVLQTDGTEEKDFSVFEVSSWGYDRSFLWFEEVGDPGVVSYVPLRRVHTFDVRKPEAAPSD